MYHHCDNIFVSELIGGSTLSLLARSYLKFLDQSLPWGSAPFLKENVGNWQGNQRSMIEKNIEKVLEPPLTILSIYCFYLISYHYSHSSTIVLSFDGSFKFVNIYIK